MSAADPLPLTALGKAIALEALKRRRASKPERIDNSRLPAGSPMTYYCIGCGHPSCVLPEAHIKKPSTLCRECWALKEVGWLE